MSEPKQDNMNLKVDDRVRVISQKFPENNKKISNQKSIIAPASFQGRSTRGVDREEMVENLKYKQTDPWKGKLINYTYSAVEIDYIGRTGVISAIRKEPECEYEIETGDIAKYVVRLDNKRTKKYSGVNFYPSQLIKI